MEYINSLNAKVVINDINQLTGFYMTATLAFDELRKTTKQMQLRIVKEQNLCVACNTLPKLTSIFTGATATSFSLSVIALDWVLLNF